MKKIEREYPGFLWVDIENGSEKDLQSLDLPIPIDENLIEDALEIGHLPKFESLDGYGFMILRAYALKENCKAIDVKEISNKIAFLIYPHQLVTIHRFPISFLAEDSHPYQDIDELVLSLINEILLTYDEPTRIQTEKMDEFERQLFLKNNLNLSSQELYFQKSVARLTKKILSLTQTVINHLPEQNPKYQTSLRDLKDTTLDFILRSEEVIDDTASLFNSYMSITAQKSNDVMKLLTIFSAFFLPLTFLVGLYGMNFDNMPELHWKYGYYILLGTMVVISIITYQWFKRKKII